MVSSQARRDQVALALEHGHSQRQACELMELPRSILKYRSVQAERDAPVLAVMRRIAAMYPRYGYRRVRIFLRREGHAMGPQRAYRLWRSAGLQLPRRRPRRRVATSRPRPRVRERGNSNTASIKRLYYCVEYTATPPLGKAAAHVEQPPGAAAEEYGR